MEKRWKRLKKKAPELTIYFFFYAILGWIYETILEVFIYKAGFSNRGVLFGPYLPVYGVGALLFLFTSYPLIKKKEKKWPYIPLIFVTTALSATLVELITSYLCEWTIGYIPWDYSRYAITFDNRIALNTSLRFGLGGVLFLYICQPFFEKLTRWLGKNRRETLAQIIFGLFVIEILFRFR